MTKALFAILFSLMMLVLYFNSEILGIFNNTKDLERCADQYFVRGYDYPKGVSREVARQGFLKDLAAKDIKEKSKHPTWLSYYRDCETMKKKTPDTFKLEYRK